MWSATVKSILHRRSRLLLSLLAIVMGVGFLASVLTFNATLRSNFQSLMSSGVADVNVQARGAIGDDDPIQPKDNLSEDVRRAVADVPGVTEAVGDIFAQGIYPLDRDGRLLGNTQAPAMAGKFHTSPGYKGVQGARITDGRAPTGNNEVVIDSATFTKGGFAFGDTITFTSVGEAGSFDATIVGVVGFGDTSSAGATYALFSEATAQRLLVPGGTGYTSLWVVTDPGADRAEVARKIEALLPTDYEAIDGATAADKLNQQIMTQLGFMETLLLIFAGVGLAVTVFLIVNTFGIVVAQRRRELALFRAMGASRWQIFGTVLLEAFIVGLLGSAIGVLVGLALAKGIVALIGVIGLELGDAPLTLPITSVLVCVGVGVAATLVAALAPARGASRIPPMAAMARSENSQTRGIGIGPWIALGALGVGLVLLALVRWMTALPQSMLWLAAGALLTLVGALLATPVFSRPLVALLARPYRWVGGQVGVLADRNVSRNPRRVALTAAALMIGTTLVTSVAVLASSGKSSLQSSVSTGIKGDVLVSNPGFQPWTPQLRRSMEKVDGVSRVDAAFITGGKHDGKNVNLTAQDDMTAVVDRTVTEGRLPAATGEVALEQKWAQEHDLVVGDSVPVSINGADVTLPVVGTFRYPDGVSFGALMVTRMTLLDNGLKELDSIMTVTLDETADLETVKSHLRDEVRDFPLLAVQDLGEFADQMSERLDTILTVFYALLLVAVFIAIVGIVNTLVLSVLERKREIGLLRAVGFVRSQMRAMIALEAIVVALLGTILGIALGLVMGAVLQHVMVSDGFSRLVIPWGQVGLFAVLAVVVGFLASIIPAAWAARVDVLRAITDE